MPVCIYCKVETIGNEPEDHPIPQALGTGKYPLPRGAVCGGCNSYLGDLDQNICNHHHLAGLIVFGNLRGTDGPIRKTVTDGFRFNQANQHLTLRGGSGSVENDTLVIRDAGNLKFDPWKFSRGLHRIALGLLAHQMGTERALSPAYDAARAYIRRPTGRAQFWAYFQRPSDKIFGYRSFPAALAARGFQSTFALAEPATFVYLNLFVSEFVVALHGDVRGLDDSDRQQLALGSGLSEAQLSKRPWLFFGRADAGDQIEIHPDVFKGIPNPASDK